MNNKFFYIALILIVGMGVFIGGEKITAGYGECTGDVSGGEGRCCNPDENFCWKGTMENSAQCTRCCVGFSAECVEPPEKECGEIYRTGACYTSLTDCVDIEGDPASDCPSNYPYCCVPGAWCTKTCEGEGWHCCAPDEHCTGDIQFTGFCDCGIYPPGASRCCNDECSEHPSCESLGGSCCQEWEVCLGENFESAYNCTPIDKCCVGGECVEPSTDTCEEIGEREGMSDDCCSSGQECEGGYSIWADDCNNCCIGGTCSGGNGNGVPGWGECATNTDCETNPKYGVGYVCECLPKNYTGTEKIGLCAPDGSTVICPPTKHTSFAALLDSIINFIFNIALVIAPIMFIIAGFSYITCAGDPAKIKKSADIAIYTAVGLIVVLLARGIIQVIQDIVV